MEKEPKMGQQNNKEAYTSGEITAKGGKMDFLGENGVAEFLQKYGDDVPEDISHSSKYGDTDYQKHWRVKIETSEGTFNIPTGVDFRDCFGGEKKAKGMSTKEFIESKGIKVEDIKKITLDIAR